MLDLQTTNARPFSVSVHRFVPDVPVLLPASTAASGTRLPNTALGAMTNGADSDFSDCHWSDDDANWDVESARTCLERLMSEQQGIDCDDNDNNDYQYYEPSANRLGSPEITFARANKLNPPFLPEQTIGAIGGYLHAQPHGLTSIARIRRTTEINLLSQLETDLQAVDALNHFWVHERGAKAARDLQKADEAFRQGESMWNNAERMFTHLVQEYGPQWVEPLHRLGVLYYLQGRHAEARLVEESVLRSKPWHIGALSNYVRIAESQHDVETALLWAAHRLPPRIGRRRSEWVQRSVQAAMDSLSQVETRLAMFLGEDSSLRHSGEEAWQ